MLGTFPISQNKRRFPFASFSFGFFSHVQWDVPLWVGKPTVPTRLFSELALGIYIFQAPAKTDVPGLKEKQILIQRVWSS